MVLMEVVVVMAFMVMVGLYNVNSCGDGNGVDGGFSGDDIGGGSGDGNSSIGCSDIVSIVVMMVVMGVMVIAMEFKCWCGGM